MAIMFTDWNLHDVVTRVTGSCRTSPDLLTIIVLKIATIVGEIKILQRKDGATPPPPHPPKNLLHSCECLSCVFRHALQKYIFQLDLKNHCGVTLQGSIISPGIYICISTQKQIQHWHKLIFREVWHQTRRKLKV